MSKVAGASIFPWHAAFKSIASGLLLATLGAIALNGKAIIAKLAYRHGVDAVTLILYRMLFAMYVWCAGSAPCNWWGRCPPSSWGCSFWGAFHRLDRRRHGAGGGMHLCFQQGPAEIVSPPGIAIALANPLGKGATPADWQSQICGVCWKGWA
jgi:hypothetical protein